MCRLVSICNVRVPTLMWVGSFAAQIVTHIHVVLYIGPISCYVEASDQGTKDVNLAERFCRIV